MFAEHSWAFLMYLEYGKHLSNIQNLAKIAYVEFSLEIGKGISRWMARDDKKSNFIN